MKLKLSKIEIYGGTQPREEINEDIVSEYAEAMQDGDKFPPVVVFDDGAKKWLADGFHRVHASHKVGFLEIEAEIKRGTRRDAILYSVGANSDHGLRRSNEDKRKAVSTLLEDEEWRAEGIRWIARTAKVSEGLAHKMYHEYVSVHDEQIKPDTRKVRRGDQEFEMDTSNIGNGSESNNSGTTGDLDTGGELTTRRDVFGRKVDIVDSETGEVIEKFEHRYAKTEDQKERCPCCGQVLPDNV